MTRVARSFVTEFRNDEAGQARLQRFFELTGIGVIDVTPRNAEIAIDANRRFGKHRAALNRRDGFVEARAVAAVTSALQGQ